MKNIKKYYNLIKKYRYALFFALILNILSSYGSIVLPRLIGEMADFVKSGTLTKEILIKDIYILSFMSIFIYISDAIWNYIIFRNYYYVSANLKKMILSKSLFQSPVFFKRNTISEIINKSTSDTMRVADVVGYGFMTVVDGAIFPILIFISMAKISTLLALISMVALPVMVFIITKISTRYDPTYEAYQKSLDTLNQKTIEDMSAIKVIKAFVVGKVRKENYLKSVDDNLAKDLRLTKLTALYVPVTEIGIGFFSIIAFIVGASLIKHGNISYGQLVTFSLYLYFLEWPAFGLSDLIVVLKEGNTSLRRIGEILDYEDDFKEYKGNEKIKSIDKIEMNNVYFSYPGNDSFGLKNINLSFQKGKRYGIVGKTGSGKTSLLRVIINEYPNFSGQVKINGSDIKEISLDDLKKNIGYVPQEHFLYSKTIKENIAFYRDATDVEVKNAIKVSDFEKDISSLPLGVYTLSGEMGVSLSGGQKQRVSLSRAVLKDVDMLVLDDVLSAVDNKTEQNILENLEKLMGDKIVVMSSHKISAIKDCDEIIVLDDGEIIETGTYDELLDNKGWFYEQAMIQEVSHE